MNVNKISSFINHSKRTQKVLSLASKNPAVFDLGVSFACASIIRPLTIIPMPMKSKEDKKYSIASSISSGLTEILTAPLIFMPMQKIWNKTGKLLLKQKNTVFTNCEKNVKQWKSVNNRLFKMALLPFISLFRFAIVSPVVKALYGQKGGK
jgi:hypothetical protein